MTSLRRRQETPLSATSAHEALPFPTAVGPWGPSKVVNLTSKLRQTKRPGELSFSPKSPAVGYEHLW